MCRISQIQVKVTKQLFPLGLFIMLYSISKLVLAYESVDEILPCDPSKILRAVVSCGAVYNAVTDATIQINATEH